MMTIKVRIPDGVLQVMYVLTWDPESLFTNAVVQLVARAPSRFMPPGLDASTSQTMESPIANVTAEITRACTRVAHWTLASYVLHPSFRADN